MVHAPPQLRLRSLESSQRPFDLTAELGQIVWPTVRESALGVGPYLFVGIELGRVGGKRFEMETREPPAHLAHALALVDAGVVPEHHHVAAKVPE